MGYRRRLLPPKGMRSRSAISSLTRVAKCKPCKAAILPSQRDPKVKIVSLPSQPVLRDVPHPAMLE